MFLMRLCLPSAVLAATVSFAFSSLADSHIYPSITVTGDPVVVFDHKAGLCDDLDIPDASLRAYRRDDGYVVAFASHYRSRRLVGPSLLTIRHNCKIVYEGHHLADPALFDDRTWIASTWTDDGKKIIVLGHNEYQADKFPGKCRFLKYSECWYNSIVPMVSSDTGNWFTRADTSIPQPVAAPPFRNEVGQGRPRGYFDPSNIIHDNGYYYALIEQSGIAGEPPGRCLFRNKNINSYLDWSFFDGNEFVSSLGSPYDNGTTHGPCKTVTGLSGEVGSIGRLADSHLFIAFMIASHANIAEGGAVDVAFSEDLFHWFGRSSIFNLRPAWVKGPAQGWRYHYASVLDESDPGRNFDAIGGHASLFLVRLSCVPGENLVRDLIRIPLSITNVGG